jgi:hypothetical protein
MAGCEVCGNDYDKAFTITRIFCCAHCARESGVRGVDDRA